jgi:hypothetical protein
MADSLAALLLPVAVERFELETHVRGLLSIPRVLALEPRTSRPPPAFARDVLALRQARRLRFPGEVRLLVLYHPAQYALARALRDSHVGAELWYVEQDEPDSPRRGELEELREYDALARERATEILVRTVGVDGAVRIEDGALRERLRELDVISPYAFVPTVRGRRHARQRLS